MREDFEEISKVIGTNYDRLQGTLDEFNTGAKPLGESNQEKIRKFMHQLYGNYNSWVADRIVRYNEEGTDLESITEDLEKGTKHFGTQSYKKVKQGIDRAVSGFIRRNDFGRREQVEQTFYDASANVLNRSKESAITLNTQINGAKKEKVSVLG